MREAVAQRGWAGAARGAARTRHRRSQLRAWGFTGPGVIWVFAFTVFPLVRTLVLAFQATTLYGNEWAGLRNFVRLWRDYRFWSALRVTLVFVVCSVAVTLVLGTVLALALNRGLRGTRFFRALAILPMFAAPIALGYLGLTIFYEQGGPVNNVLARLGLPAVHWLSNGRWAMVSVLAVDVWQWTPFVFLVVLAALQSVPQELVEAGRLETDSGWKLFTQVTLPLIRVPLGTVIILRIVEAFKVFDIPFTLTNGGPGIATRTMTYDVYTTALRNQDFGYAASIAVVMLILVSAVALIFYRVQGETYQ